MFHWQWAVLSTTDTPSTMNLASYIYQISKLRFKFLLIVLPPVIACFIIFSIIFSIITFREMKQDIISNLNNHAKVQAKILAKALWDVNFKTIKSQIKGIILIPEVSGIKVTEFTTQRILHAGFNPDNDTDDQYFQVKSDIIFHVANKKHFIGELLLFSDKQIIYAPLMRSFTRDTLLLLLLITAIIASAVWANKLIVDKPLRRFLASIHRADQDNVREPVAWRSKDELGTVILAYNKMLNTLNEAEKKLRTSEAYYRTVFETTATATLIIEEDTTIALVNSQFEKLSGYRKDEIEGKMQTGVFIFKDDRERLRQYHIRRRKQKDINPSEYEFRFVDRSGTVKNIYSQVSMIPGTQRSISALMDITFLKEAEKALRQEKEKFQILVEKLPLGIALITKDSRYQYINPEFVEIFGYTLDDIPTGREWFKKAFPDPHYRQEIYSFWLKDLESYSVGQTRPRVFTVRCKDNTEKIIHFRSVTMEAGEQFVLYEDITARKKLEEQLQHSQKMEAIGTLAGGIAHDFNNLLMGVQGRTSLMLINKGIAPDLRGHLKEVERYVKSATDLTKQLLGFARGGKYVVKSTNLNKLIQKQNRLFGRTKKEINIHETFAPDLWKTEVDRGQIEQVLLNLYVNAWQAMPGGGDLYICTDNMWVDNQYEDLYDMKEGRWVKITVADTGAGIDENIRQRIFDPFFTTKEMERGTGLGLASCYGIIKNHDGVIYVSSEAGQGATFNIFLPASDKKAAKEIETSESAESEESEELTESLEPIQQSHETILLIDDEDIIIDVGQEMLSDLGYKVLLAISGRDAVDVYRKNRADIDMIILDMIMPDMSGSETFDQLKSANPDIKVLLSSGYSIDSEASEILSRGCDGFIQKPFSLDQLSRKMREILDKK